MHRYYLLQGNFICVTEKFFLIDACVFFIQVDSNASDGHLLQLRFGIDAADSYLVLLLFLCTLFFPFGCVRTFYFSFF